MTKSELIEVLAAEQPQLAHRDVELAVNGLLEHMAQALAGGDRIEVRGFGSLSLHHRPARVGRNPKTGESVPVPEKHVPHFKPGRDLRERVDNAASHSQAASSASGPTGAASASGPAAANKPTNSAGNTSGNTSGNTGANPAGSPVSGSDGGDPPQRTAGDSASPRISAAPGTRSES